MKINLYPYRKFLILNALIALAVLISIIYVNWNDCDYLVKALVYVLVIATIGSTSIVDVIYLIVERNDLKWLL